MSLFRLIASGVDVSGVLAELDRQPELWGQNAYRGERDDSPHFGVPDIWLRWRRKAELTSLKAYTEPHFASFWPAWFELPSLHPIVRNLSHVVNATHMGGILITKVPAGEQVKPHVDSGWHARFFDCKLYLTLRANPLCLNYCGDDVENFRAGDVWEYPNSVMHSTVNNGTTDRITCIICFRTVTHETAEAGRTAD